jgi:VIT1/CCC1 family predicted Fe2+/Mn2+ transporter
LASTCRSRASGKQLRDAPDQEHEILRQIYRDRGFSEEEAKRFVDAVFDEPDHAVRLLIFEEVGLDERSIGSPLAAAVGSFVAFTLGAFVPLLPYLLATGQVAFVASLLLSLGALALLGAGIAMLTRRPLWYGIVRQVALGGTAAAVTYAVGTVIGVAGG